MRIFLFFFVSIACLYPTVAGWAFLVRSSVISEGASATFEITDDGGGFTFPYTMTVLKQVPNASDEQVGLVLTSGNETTFYWTCNQPAGTSVRFRLMSGAQVNAATSRYYEIQPSAQATASSLSVLSVQSTSSLYAKTQTAQESGIATSLSGATATSIAASVSSAKIGTGVIVGCIIGGVLLLLIIGLVVFWMRRRKRSNAGSQGMVQYDPNPHITPFADGRTAQTIVPPMGYVSQSNFGEAPPVYSPHEAEATTYFTGSESGRTESSFRPPPSTGKYR